MMSIEQKNNVELAWNDLDIENRFSFRSRKFTGVNFFFSFLVGIFFFCIFYGILLGIRLCLKGQEITMIEMFFHGGPKNRSYIPYVTVFLSCWAMAILVIKSMKLSVQKKALNIKILPPDYHFTLTSHTAKEIIDNIYTKVDDPSKFVLLDRIDRAISNLKNLGNVSAVTECLKNQAENDENYLSTTYTMLKGFVWAIPVLGFIGTVVGLADSVGGFGDVVKQSSDIEKIKEALGGVTGGLGTAFETTLIALVLALIVQLLMTYIMNKEEYFLDECSDYCHKYIISKMKSCSELDKEI